MLRRVIVGLAVLAALASGLWFVSARGIERVVTGWLEARAAEGWLVRYEDLGVTGFPSRFRTEFTAMELADPETNWVWTLPALTLEQRAFRPDHLRATWPATQELSSPDQRLTITAATMTSELDVQPSAGFALDLSDTVLADVAVESDAGWRMTLPQGHLTMARRDGEASFYDVSFSASEFAPPAPFRTRLDPAAILPETISVLDYEAGMRFDRPWDIRAIEDRRPQITYLDLKELEAVWGGLLLRAAGTLDVDASGLPEGEIALRAENWRDMIAMAVNAGIIPERMRGTAEGLLGVVAGLSGDPEVIDAALGFSGGRMFLGPLPLGPAPRLVLR
ncbi:DUF2125 domain-containing protein [Roseibacterium sp. SDUM158016]|uniref:DUF2125 domain-containing protein n=1 Tax=Roseicyclus sediminis TaxID=2980997 RepID=UPI0021D1F9D8|nr:DUF2125 domain-containing protein [Roseibacterium sp. SDUM158016]MCU4654899.1 DUF2125 domain-containing protein [Roseibacterium sp. SDUM158016]